MLAQVLRTKGPRFQLKLSQAGIEHPMTDEERKGPILDSVRKKLTWFSRSYSRRSKHALTDAATDTLGPGPTAVLCCYSPISEREQSQGKSHRRRGTSLISRLRCVSMTIV